MGVFDRKIAVFMIAFLSLMIACNKTVSVTIDCCCDADVNPPKPLQFFAVGSEEDDIATSLAVSDDAIFVLGIISGELDYPLENNLNDLALFKLDKDGTIVEQSQFGSDQKDYAQSILFSEDEHLLMAGWDESPDGGTRLGEKRDSRPFVMKRDLECGEVWTNGFGTQTDDYASTLLERSDGKLLISGITYGDFNDKDKVNAVTNLFVVMTDRDGVVEQVTQWGTDGNDWVSDMAFLGDSLLVVGATGGVFDGNISSGVTDSFISKIDHDGRVLWTRQFGTAQSDTILAVTVDSSENIYVVGQTYGAFDEGSPSGESHTFTVALTPDGIIKWIDVLSYDVPNVGYDIALWGENIVIVGVTLGGLFEQPFQGESDMMISGYSKAGERLFYWQEGGPGRDALFSLTIDGDDFYSVGWSEGIPRRKVVTKKMDMLIVSGAMQSILGDH
ncbi:SBBP repeat-containing protein [bacterium]|nr:SBBP repeat-containing protein [bacterium]